ncbi:phosphotransferase [Alicyclobacillus fodiniaquatilis]|uniref:Phosphotransferase n=1 Tax=Alicyclobacillus fodiniaquatilis TaxID=1661150 RepID=A0ABW4JE49_9BACL
MLEEHQSSLHTCLSRLFGRDEIEIVDYAITSINTPMNFTTDGIFKIRGNAKVGYQVYEWSIVVKIIKPDSQEKNDPSHHNYWKREALIHSSGLLTKLPPIVSFPQCYLVEEKTDGTVWLWMDEVKVDNDRLFSQDEWAFIARQVGFLNGAYLSDMPLPEEPWICRQWLRSWVDGCKKYASDPFQHYSKIHNRFSQIDSLWARFLQFEANMDRHILALNHLPRVLAHQDLSKGNMYISNTDLGPKLTLIDWQFMSVSGLGEDLGKLYGVAMSQGNIPRDSYEFYKELLFQNYMDGLTNAGWQGSISRPRYGFCVSLACRSVWEVPKLLKILVDSNMTEMKDEAVELIRINKIHMDCAKEAEHLSPYIGGNDFR